MFYPDRADLDDFMYARAKSGRFQIKHHIGFV